MKKRNYIIFILCAILYMQCAIPATADTVYTKDNKEIKGIVLEDYKDRVVLSTVDGEQTVMKADIKELYFDTEEQNLIKFAEQSKDKGDYIKAFVYYDKAFKINPNSKEAKDGIVFLQGYLFKKDMTQKEDVVKRHNDFEQFGIRPETVVKNEQEKLAEDINKLKATAGITLKADGGDTLIDSVAIDSPAYEAGIRKGDILVAVWSRLVGYMSASEVMEMLLEKTSLETKCTIERRVDLKINANRNLLSNTNDLIGINLNIQFDGLTVSAVKADGPAAEAGVKPADVIVEINGESTRYMPLKRAIELIKKSKGDTVELALRREIVIWGKEGG